MNGRPLVRAAFFDIGNVLLRFSHRAVLRKFAWAAGRHPLLVAKRLFRDRVLERIETGAIDGEGIYRLFHEELGWRGSFAEFRGLWCDHFTLDRGSHALLKAAGRRVPVYLLSNTNALHYDWIRERYSFPSQVRGAILSHEVRLRKPDPAIYAAALRLSRTKAHETVFVDDLGANVRAAAEAGLVAIRYRGSADLRRRFEALGLA